MKNRFCDFVAFATKELPEDGHMNTPHTYAHTCLTGLPLLYSFLVLACLHLRLILSQQTGLSSSGLVVRPELAMQV